MRQPDGWTLHEDRRSKPWKSALTREFKFADFKATMAFVNAVAAIAEAGNHHPFVMFGYNEVEVIWTTHDSGDNITEQDVHCAEKVNEIKL